MAVSVDAVVEEDPDGLPVPVGLEHLDLDQRQVVVGQDEAVAALEVAAPQAVVGVKVEAGVVQLDVAGLEVLVQQVEVDLESMNVNFKNNLF